MNLRENIERLRKSVAETARRAGRNPDAIGILLVTKTVTPERIREAFQAGVYDFGENRVQELFKKKSELALPIRWHMVGHLQTNKVKQILGEVDLIHSLDRPELAEAIERQAKARGIRRVPVLIQIKVSDEESKFGFAPAAVRDFVATLEKDSPIEIRGLMAIGPMMPAQQSSQTAAQQSSQTAAQQSSQTADEDKIRAAFRAVRKCREELARQFPEKNWDVLSMGMSADYRIAIEEGSTLIRIGTAVFGMRGSK